MYLETSDGRTITAYVPSRMQTLDGYDRCSIRRMAKDFIAVARTDYDSRTITDDADGLDYARNRVMGGYSQRKAYTMGWDWHTDGTYWCLERLEDGGIAVLNMDDDGDLYIVALVEDDLWGRVGGLFNLLDECVECVECRKGDWPELVAQLHGDWRELHRLRYGEEYRDDED